MGYTADDFGPSHRWSIFVCSQDGHPMRVGYVAEEYAETSCPVCGAELVPITVGPAEAGR